jgi:hypothetical protein
MAIIIETCPKCGHDLMDVILPTNPPIPKKECCGCGWSWTGKQEEVIRVPFGGNGLIVDDLVGICNSYTLEDCTVLNNYGYVDAKISTHHIDCVNGTLRIIND